jgi:hypothetical protein
VFCGPIGLPGQPDALYHNNGDGTFTDVTTKAGIRDPNAGSSDRHSTLGPKKLRAMVRTTLRLTRHGAGLGAWQLRQITRERIGEVANRLVLQSAMC